MQNLLLILIALGIIIIAICSKILSKRVLLLLFIIGFSFNSYARPPSINNSKTYNSYYITNKNIKNQHKAELIIKLNDTKRFTTRLKGDYDFNNEVYSAIISFEIKLGKSYEEKLIEELKKEKVWKIK